MSNLFAWFTTPQARKFAAGLATTAACGAFAISYLPQSIFIDKYQNFVTIRKHEIPVPVPPNLQNLFTQVLDDLNLNQYQKTLIKPFLVFGFDVWHAGSLNTRFGSIIGFPINFTYKNLKSIDTSSIVIHHQTIDWSNDDAKKLLDSFLLSDDAQKYGMAREILMTNNSNIIYQSVLNSTLVGGTYIVSSLLNDYFLMFQRPRGLRIIMYGFIAGLFWTTWAMQKDLLIKYNESNVDKQISKLGANYIKGGIEYYEKCLQRNIALRNLMGEEGEYLFTAKGNETYFIRTKHLPIAYRKNYFTEKLKALEILESGDSAISI